MARSRTTRVLAEVLDNDVRLSHSGTQTVAEPVQSNAGLSDENIHANVFTLSL